MEYLGTDFNIVDLVAFVLILLSVIGGIRQGFISGLLDLLGLAVGIYLAFKGYRPVAAFLPDVLPLPAGIANIAGFIILFVVSQALLALVVGLLVRGVKRVLGLFPPLRIADALAGAVPGLLKGVVGVTLLLLPFGLFPIVPQVKAEIERSYVGSRAISFASEATPRLESLLGQAAEETMIFLTRPESDSSTQLNFPVPAQLSPDASSEQRMLDLLNAERTKEGLQPLVMDETLQIAARKHSEEMFELSYFAHQSPVAGSPADRMRKEGARFSFAGENLAFAPNVEMAHSGLMNSPGHRKNILTPGFKRIGIGVIDGGLSGKMFTQNFTD